MEAIESDSVMNELLGLGSFNKRSQTAMLEAVVGHHRSLLVMAAAFIVGLTVGFIESNERNGKKIID